MRSYLPNDSGIFFDKNINTYGNVGLIHSDFYFLSFLKAQQKQSASLLDIGGGVGSFAKIVVNSCPGINVTVVDPSQKSLSMIDDVRIKRVKGILPNSISLDSSFDYIHIKEVFHHITGSSIRGSKELLRESLLKVKEYLNDEGFLLIHEIFYESYLIPSLSRDLIFYLLLLQNSLRIKIPLREFLSGLQVCFYTRAELRSMLDTVGFGIVEYQDEYWRDNKFKKSALFLKNWGRMLFILEKTK